MKITTPVMLRKVHETFLNAVHFLPSKGLWQHPPSANGDFFYHSGIHLKVQAFFECSL